MEIQALFPTHRKSQEKAFTRPKKPQNEKLNKGRETGYLTKPLHTSSICKANHFSVFALFQRFSWGFQGKKARKMKAGNFCKKSCTKICEKRQPNVMYKKPCLLVLLALFQKRGFAKSRAFVLKLFCFLILQRCFY